MVNQRGLWRALLCAAAVGAGAVFMVTRLPPSIVIIGMLLPGVGAAIAAAVIVGGGRMGRGVPFQVLALVTFLVMACLAIGVLHARTQAAIGHITLLRVLTGIHGEGLLAALGILVGGVIAFMGPRQKPARDAASGREH
jgi:hypothetical protein